jgi:membrane fusion protein, heavy metal efflux system
MLTKSLSAILWVSVLFGCTCCIRARHNYPIINDSTGHPAAVHLSVKEAVQAGIQLGSLSEKTVDRWAFFSGNFVLSRKSLISISAPAPGIIKLLDCSAGSYVEAGTVLAGLESTEFIRLQQEFLDAKNQIEYYREEFKRQGELTVENATSLKKMQMAQRDYQSYELKLNALRLQLETYGICADSLKFDRLASLFVIKAPQSASVIKVNARLGAYANLGDELLVLSKDSRLLLKFIVPEQLLPCLKKGLPVEFSLMHDTLTTYRAILQHKAASIDPINHTAEIYVRVPEPNDSFLPGLSVNARIKTRTDVALCVPARSIIDEPGGKYIFVLNQGNFEKVPVKTGDTSGGLIEITDFSLNSKKDSVVMAGGSFLNTILGQH